MDWQGAPASPSSFTVKRILRLEIPVDNYPNVKFILILVYFTCLLITGIVIELPTSLLFVVQFCWPALGPQR